MRLPAILLLSVLPLAAGQGKGAPPKAAASPAPAPLRWDGEWRLVEEGSASLGTAVPEHVKDLNFALKAFWKRKLEKACPRETALSLILGTNLTATFGKEAPVTIQGDGSAVSWTRADGEAFQVTMAREGAKLSLTLEGDGYTLRRVLSQDEAGTMTLRTTYQHPKCPAGDFSYSLVFRRRD